jgi:hypothetical protein
MDQILAKVAEDWPVFSLGAIILISIFRSQLFSFLPKTLQDHFKNKARLRADQQEHEQLERLEQFNLTKLKALSQLSSLSFTEEQLTQLTAETQVQLNEANTFIRQLVSDKLDIIIEQNRFILIEIRMLKKGNGNGNDNKTNTKTLA